MRWGTLGDDGANQKRNRALSRLFVFGGFWLWHSLSQLSTLDLSNALGLPAWYVCSHSPKGSAFTSRFFEMFLFVPWQAGIPARDTHRIKSVGPELNRFSPPLSLGGFTS